METYVGQVRTVKQNDVITTSITGSQKTTIGVTKRQKEFVYFKSF